MTTMQKIFELEGYLSPSHVTQIRSALMPDSSPDQYLQTLEDEAKLSRLAMTKAGVAVKPCH